MARTRTSILFAVLLLADCLHAQFGIEWQRVLGGTGDDIGHVVVAAPDGGFLVAGVLGSNGATSGCAYQGVMAWVLKLDAQGAMQWQKCLGGSGADRFYDLKITPDGGCVLVGETYSNNGDVSGNHGMGDIWVVKLDSNHEVQWQRCYGGSLEDRGQAIIVAGDGSLVLTGRSRSGDGDMTGNWGDEDLVVIKLDADGDLLWQRNLGGSLHDFGNALCETSDGDLVVVGQTLSSDGDVTDHFNQFDLWAVRLDQQGAMLWQRCLGGTNWEIGHAVLALPGGACLVAGETLSNDGAVSGNNGPVNVSWGTADQWLVQLDASGGLVQQRCIGGDGMERAFSLVPTPTGYLIGGEAGSLNGFANPVFGSQDFCLVGLGTDLDPDWALSLGGSFSDVGYSAEGTLDGGMIVTGYTLSTDGQVQGALGEKDLWVVKLGPLQTGAREYVDGSKRVAPNPASDELILRQVRIGDEVIVSDALGGIVARVRATGAEQRLSVSEWPRGVYLFQYRSAEGIGTERIVLH